jgi:hypothetical protein
MMGLARSFYDAWVVLMLWSWFIVPLGAVRIHYWHAYGLDLVIGLMAVPGSAIVFARTEDGDAYQSSLRAFSAVLAGYTVALGVGFCAHKFMGG